MIKIFPISFDSFSTRSMATFIKTDINLFIDPSIAIAPKRYSLPPSKLELNSLEEGKKKILELYKQANVFIITHYHWDHCPNPKEKHFEVFKSKSLFLIKNFNENINKSQQIRAKTVIEKAKKINPFFHFQFADNKEFYFEKTYLNFSPALWHGVTNTPLGKVLAVEVSYKNDSLVFASDIQGILNEETKEWLIKTNPKILILSGPATYHHKWNKKLTDISNKNLIDFIEKTDVKEIIIDHHLSRDLNFKEKLEDVYKFGGQFGVKILTAAEFLGMKNLQLEAHRKEF